MNKTNVPFYVPEVLGLFQETAGGSLFKDMASDKYKETTYVKLRTLDSFLDEFYRIDFIKVDIEGAEYEFLEGAINTIRKFRPIIQIELVGDEKKLNKFKNFIANIDYDIKRLSNNKLIDIKIDNCDDLNVFLIPKSRPSATLQLSDGIDHTHNKRTDRKRTTRNAAKQVAF